MFPSGKILNSMHLLVDDKYTVCKYPNKMQTVLLNNGVGLWDRTETLSSDATLAQRRRSKILALSVHNELPSVREERKREVNLFSLHEKHSILNMHIVRFFEAAHKRLLSAILPKYQTEVAK